VSPSASSKFTSPQKVLDGLVSSLAFDPLEFMRMESRSQFNVLKGIAKLSVDIDALDRENKHDYDLRHSLNSQKKALDARLSAFPEFPRDLPSKPLDVSAISHELAEAHSKNSRLDLEDARRNDALQRAIKNEAAAKAKIARLESELDTARNDHKRFQAQIVELQEPAQAEKVDTSTLTAQLQSAESTNKLITQRAEYVSLSQQSAKAFLDSEELTQAMEQREIEKQKAIASA